MLLATQMMWGLAFFHLFCIIKLKLSTHDGLRIATRLLTKEAGLLNPDMYATHVCTPLTCSPQEGKLYTCRKGNNLIKMKHGKYSASWSPWSRGPSSLQAHVCPQSSLVRMCWRLAWWRPCIWLCRTTRTTALHLGSEKHCTQKPPVVLVGLVVTVLLMPVPAMCNHVHVPCAR